MNLSPISNLRFRVVLGAWHTEGSMVKVTADDVELIQFSFLTTNGQILKKAPN